MTPDFIGQTALLSMLIPIVAMVIGLLIVLFAIQRNYKVRQLEHEERMRALEKGINLPPLTPQKKKHSYPFAWPFIFIGFGLALLCIYWFADGDSASVGFGLISLFIGLALFASRFFGVKKNNLAHEEHTLRSQFPPTAAAPQTATETNPPSVESPEQQ